MNIREKLLVVQQELKAPKNNKNEFGNFNYRSCEDIQEAAKPILNKIKAVLILGDEIVSIDGRFYVKATAKLCDVESDEEMSNVAYARECESKPKMDAAQITGSCSSYARKYALNGLLCIDDTKDADTMDNSKAHAELPEVPKRTPGGSSAEECITQAEWSQISRAGGNNALIIYEVMGAFGYAQPGEIKKKDVPGILQEISRAMPA